MEHFEKKLSLKTSENIIFTNNYLSKTISNSKSCLKTIKSNKSLKLRLNKKKNLYFNNESYLKNINKKYIEKNILRIHVLSSQFQRTHFFNKIYYKSENEKTDNENKINANIMRLKSRIIKNINFHELISSNDINISTFNIAKYTNRRNIFIKKKYQNRNNYKIKFNDSFHNSQYKQKKLLTSKIDAKEKFPKMIKLKKIGINNKYKTINLEHAQSQSPKYIDFNSIMNNASKIKYFKVRSNGLSNMIFTKIKMKRDKSESKFYHRLNKNSFIKKIIS